MKNINKIISTVIVVALFAAVFVMFNSCESNNKNPSDGTDTVTKPEDPTDDSFWLYSKEVHSPTEVSVKTDMEKIRSLYSSMTCSEPANVVLRSGSQVLAMEARGDGTYNPVIYLFDGEKYVPLFDGSNSIISNGSIELYPAEFETGKKNGFETCAVKGNDLISGNPFTIYFSAVDDGLIMIDLSLKMKANVNFGPTDIGLHMKGAPEVSYSQMPASIYGDASFGLGMPAAYLWDSGREAVILLDYTDMTWLSGSQLPARGSKVMASDLRNGQTAFGLIQTGGGIGNIYSGTDVTVKMFVYGGFAEKRSGVECIAQKAAAVAYAHPSMVELPTIRKDLKSSYTLDWKLIARGTAKALTNELSYNKVSLIMTDPILSSEKRGKTLNLHYARQNAERYTATDFSCNNNWLSAANLFSRLNHNDQFDESIETKMDALQFYYDPESNMIRYGFRYGNQVGTYEMPWQNFFYDVETERASMTSSIENFSPAALANLLSSIEGMTELVENNDYVLSQWIYPNTKTSATQQDRPDLNIVYEPWQIGSYAYVLVKAYDITGDENYLKLAETALDQVINKISFEVNNEVYSKKYSDSAEFPITELYGTANGTYAAYRLFELTGEEQYLKWSEDFFGMLVQLTFWYDDNFSDAAKTSTWVGLFEPHGGAGHPCPWETVEAYLPMTEILDATGDYRFNDLMLKLFNCERVSSFNFYPITWSDYFKSQMAYNEPNFYCIPTEPMYNSFSSGNSDYGALYMSSISFWNYMMYSAFGECSNIDIMALNTNMLSRSEEAIRGASRRFVLYNPTDSEQTFDFIQYNLADSDYTVSYGDTKATYTKAELEKGISFTLGAGESVRVDVVANDTSIMVAARQDVMTRQRIGYAYYVLRESIQSFAAEKIREYFPGAIESDVEILSNYFLTYMSYDVAMAYIIDESQTNEGNLYSHGSFSNLCNLFSNRSVLNGRLKKLVQSNQPCPEYYEAMISAIDDANTLMKSGNYVKAYEICDSIISAVKDGKAESFTYSPVSE